MILPKDLLESLFRPHQINIQDLKTRLLDIDLLILHLKLSIKSFSSLLFSRYL